MYLTKSDFTVDTERQSLIISSKDGVRQSTLVHEGILQEYVFEDAKTLIEVMERGCDVSNNGPCLGWRDADSDYKWLSYREVIERYQNFSRGLVQAGMKKGQESFVCIYSQNCVEWILTEYACYSQSAVLVPLYDTFGPSSCSYILNHVEAEFLVCDTEKKVQSILNSKEIIPKLRHIISIHKVSKDVKKLAAEKGVTLHLFEDLEECGKKTTHSLQLPSPSDVSIICFTSGTTGDPKGVILTHGNIVAAASGIIKHLGVDFFIPGGRLLSYLPLAHMMDRIGQVVLYSTGGAVGFFRGDIKLLGEDMSSLKPTILTAVPRILNRVYDKIQNEVQSNFIKKFLFDVALRAKKADFERGIIRNDSMWDLLVLRNIQNAFGGKMRLFMIGGAPIRNEILSFYKYSFGCVVVQAYGQTECTAACSMSVIGDKFETVGPPLPCSFIKLQEVPEMGYYEKNGEGEILIKGPIVSRGYYKDLIKTAEILDKDGWLHSGDIGKWNKDGSLSVIDRKKNLMKLSQGEYISPEKIESVYLVCPLIEQIFVYGDSLENCLVAIAVPDKDHVMSWCSDQSIQGDWKEICKNEDVKGQILKNLQQLGVKAGLKGFEQVKAIHLHPEAFSLESGFLTATMKLKRPNLQKHFKDVIQKMYKSLR